VVRAFSAATSECNVPGEMTYFDSAILNLAERFCRKFQVLTGRTNVWLACDPLPTCPGKVKVGLRALVPVTTGASETS
jgi:hypothetical protein